LYCVRVESGEMTHRKRILKKLSSAGVIDLEWRFTEDNSYIRTKITEKGRRIIEMLIRIKEKLYLKPNIADSIYLIFDKT
jgi:predicted transcriptional regulator